MIHLGQAAFIASSSSPTPAGVTSTSKELELLNLVQLKLIIQYCSTDKEQTHTYFSHTLILKGVGNPYKAEVVKSQEISKNKFYFDYTNVICNIKVYRYSLSPLATPSFPVS